MIVNYKFSDTIEQCQDGEKPDWIDLASPTEAEIDDICSTYQLSDRFLIDPLDPKERPRVDLEEEAILLVFRLPILEKIHGSGKFSTIPVGIIIAPGLVITVCRHPELVNMHFKRMIKRKRCWTTARFVFSLFLTASTGFVENIEHMEELSSESEAKMRHMTENEELLRLLSLEKSLIDITIALKSNHVLMEKFLQPEPFGLTLSKDEIEVLDDALIENQQGIFMAEIFGQVLGSLSDAFGSIISNNLNKTMKFLAGITVVVMLPTLVTGFYGMNVSLPGSNIEGAFMILSGVCLALMLVVSVFFAKKKWF